MIIYSDVPRPFNSLVPGVHWNVKHTYTNILLKAAGKRVGGIHPIPPLLLTTICQMWLSIQKQLQWGVMGKICSYKYLSFYLDICNFCQKCWKNTCEVSLPAILLKMNVFTFVYQIILIGFQNSCFFQNTSQYLLCSLIFITLRYWFFF